jgi:ferric-dicitrate binding protein FerR (iron transport regulator)
MSKPLSFYIDRYLSGTISTTEWHELQVLMKEPGAGQQLSQLMEEQLAARAAGNIVYPEVTDRMKAAVARQLNMEGSAAQDTGIQVHMDNHKTRYRFLYTRWLRYAAAILILTGLPVAYFFLSEKAQPGIRQETVQKPTGTADIAPGRERALLTLADGSTIVLDSASSGILATQGNAQVIKLANGSIAYHAERGKQVETVTNTMSTPRGGKYHLVLPDGTGVWLNAASSITYPSVFTGKERAVSIKGEVYFEVVKNAQVPFIVALDHSTKIEVTGTSFNINAYADEPQCKTTLLEGIVKVYTGWDSKQLKPGQQARITVSEAQHEMTIADNVNLEQVMAWKNGTFSFKNAGIYEIMRQVSRWYDLDIEYRGITPKFSERQRFSGDIGMDLNLSAMLRVLEKSQVHFKLEGKKLIVMP